MKPVLSIAVLAVVACGGSKETITEHFPPPPMCVRSTYVTPPSAALLPGDTLRLTANGFAECGVPASPTVFWRSANASIASVGAETGVVRAIGHGSTTITALMASDTTVRAAAVITVIGEPPPPITLNSVSYVSNGKPASLDSLAGVIEVDATEETPGTGSWIAELVVLGRDTVVVATSTNPSPPKTYVHVLRWNTDARDAAGARIFPNGVTQFRARLRDTTSRTAVYTVLVQGTLKNP